MKAWKKISSMVATCILFILFSSGISVADSSMPQNVTLPATIEQTFPDKRLAYEVVQALGDGWTLGSIVTQEDLNEITGLIVLPPPADPPPPVWPTPARWRTVGSLEGIQYLRNLERFQASREGSLFSYGVIDDLSPLAELYHLRVLELRFNHIDDISPLSNLTNLRQLDLSHNLISDISPLSELSNLWMLYLEENQISDITPLYKHWGGFLVRPPIGKEISLQRQRVSLPALPVDTPFTAQNILQNSDGTIIAPAFISNNGSFDYETNILTWHNLPANLSEVFYWYPERDSSTSSLFSIEVTIPLVHSPALPSFNDVASDSWYHDYIQFVAANNIMQGTGGGRFSPRQDFSRAMLATTLWRIADEPTYAAQPGFHDVTQGQWYSDAVAWAFGKGIVEGTGPNTFAPAASITREQFATMLFRYAEATGIDLTVPSTFAWQQFTDRDTISEWAEDAMRWAVYHGLITGTSATTLSPQGDASRAQSAAILMRYMQRFVD